MSASVVCADSRGHAPRADRADLVEEFVGREAASSPFAGPIRALNADTRNDTDRDLQATLSDRVDDEGVVCLMETYVALSRVGA